MDVESTTIFFDLTVMKDNFFEHTENINLIELM